jgi:hypothetical protein
MAGGSIVCLLNGLPGTCEQDLRIDGGIGGDGGK